MNHLKAKTFTQSTIKSSIPRKVCSFNKERKPNSSLVPAYIHCETIVIHLAKVTIRFQMQFNILRSLYHAQNSLFGVHVPQTFFMLSVNTSLAQSENRHL